MYLSRYVLEQIELNLSLRFRVQTDPPELAQQIVSSYGADFMRTFVEETTPAGLIESFKETHKTDSVFYTDDGRRFIEELYVEVRKLAPPAETTS
jgi:hypothetical protein